MFILGGLSYPDASTPPNCTSSLKTQSLEGLHRNGGFRRSQHFLDNGQERSQSTKSGKEQALLILAWECHCLGLSKEGFVEASFATDRALLTAFFPDCGDKGWLELPCSTDGLDPDRIGWGEPKKVGDQVVQP